MIRLLYTPVVWDWFLWSAVSSFLLAFRLWRLGEKDGKSMSVHTMYGTIPDRAVVLSWVSYPAITLYSFCLLHIILLAYFPTWPSSRFHQYSKKPNGSGVGASFNLVPAAAQYAGASRLFSEDSCLQFRMSPVRQKFACTTHGSHGFALWARLLLSHRAYKYRKEELCLLTTYLISPLEQESWRRVFW